MELLEIEHNINLDPSIKHNLVALPKEGFCKDRLVAIVSLAREMDNETPLALFEGAEKQSVNADIEAICWIFAPAHIRKA